MIRLLVAAILVFCAIPLRAETIVVRSGEHADFSRLVVQTESIADWSVGRSAGGDSYIFRFDNSEITYDTSDIFRRMPQTRISKVVDLGDGRFKIEVNQNVHLDAFELRQGRVVLDVKNGPPPDTSSFESPIDAVEDAAVEIEPDALEKNTPKEQIVVTLPSGDALPNMPRITLPPVFENTQLPTKKPSATLMEDLPLVLPKPQSDRVKETEKKLLEQLARAASQGLIDADLEDTQKALESAANPLNKPSEVIEQLPPAMPEEPPSSALAHVRVESAVDRVSIEQGDENARPKTDEGLRCLSPSMVDLPSWGAPLSEGIKISEKRHGLVQEFDQPDPGAVLELAQYYLFLGFGAEAEAVLTEFGVIVENTDVLLAMADILDDGHSDRPERLSGQKRCSSAVAMWAVLADGELGAQEDINKEAIIQAFSALPLHLRQYLGAALAQRFLDTGDTVTATVLSNAVNRAGQDNGGAFDLVQARLALVEGDVAAAEAQLEDIVYSGEEQSPEALIDLITERTEKNMQISEKDTTLVEAFAFEYRNSELGPDLSVATIEALISHGDIRHALEQLSMNTQIPEGARDSLRVKTLGKLVELASDEEFLRLTVGNKSAFGGLEGGEKERAAAFERLLVLGFPKEARMMLGTIGPSPSEADRRALARVAFAEENHDLALAFVSTLASEADMRLKAEIFEAMQRYSDAAAIYNQLGDIDRSIALAWRAADWGTVSNEDQDEKRADAAALALDETEVSIERLGSTLSDSQSRLEGSQETRDVITKLLLSMDG